MRRGPDFIGLGAQRCGTSWIYACLYEHPEICAPVKEAHFFSREARWAKGYEWYERIFAGCPSRKKAGEFSTSYLVDPETPRRISLRYPGVKLLVSLRAPVRRAYSNYLNDLMAGAVSRRTPFAEALREHPEYVEQGRYIRQLERYLRWFAREQILVLVHEDAGKDPLRFVQSIYRFLGVDPSFSPTAVGSRINEGRVPRFAWGDRAVRKASAVARQWGGRRLWWLAKRMGVGDRLRAVNTRKDANGANRFGDADRERLAAVFAEEVAAMEALLGRELPEWRT